MITNYNSGAGGEEGQLQENSPLLVRKCPDFNLTGTGDNNEWSRTEWNYLTKLDTGGKKIANAAITSWSAELFFPYDLFRPLGNVPPASGTFWNANFYRLDYDSGKMIKWAWGPVQNSFHELNKFRRIKFE